MEDAFRYSGELLAEEGLDEVARVLSKCSWPVELRQSGYDGTGYLRTKFAVREIDLEMDSGQSGTYLFSGGVGAPLERAKALLEELSGLLGKAGFVHRIEFYPEEGNDLLAYFHHGWDPPC